MLRSVKKCIFGIFDYLLSKFKYKTKKESHTSTIYAHQEASLGFLLNMYNNINFYNITIKPKDVKTKISELEEMKKQLENYLHYGDINEIEKIGTLR